MSDCRFGVSPVNYPDPDPDPGPARDQINKLGTKVLVLMVLKIS